MQKWRRGKPCRQNKPPNSKAEIKVTSAFDCWRSCTPWTAWGPYIVCSLAETNQAHLRTDCWRTPEPVPVPTHVGFHVSYCLLLGSWNSTSCSWDYLEWYCGLIDPLEPLCHPWSYWLWYPKLDFWEAMAVMTEEREHNQCWRLLQSTRLREFLKLER